MLFSLFIHSFNFVLTFRLFSFIVLTLCWLAFVIFILILSLCLYVSVCFWYGVMFNYLWDFVWWFTIFKLYKMWYICHFIRSGFMTYFPILFVILRRFSTLSDISPIFSIFLTYSPHQVPIVAPSPTPLLSTHPSPTPLPHSRC